MLRLFLMLTVFVRTLFEFVPPDMALGVELAALAKGGTGLTWPFWVNWLLAAAVAQGFIVWARLGERVPDERPGFGLATVGLVGYFVLAIGLNIAASRVSGGSPGKLLVALVGFAVVGAPLLVLTQVLLAIGVLRMLFNLDPVELPDEGETLEPAAEVPPELPRASVEPVRFEAVVQWPGAVAPAAKPPDKVVPPAGETNIQTLRTELAALVKQQMSQQALTKLGACLASDPAFKPLADDVLPLARWLMLTKNGPTALRIMNRFDPAHPHAPVVYYLSARVLKDSRQSEQACRVLDTLLAKFPDHPIARDARVLRQSM